jgi:hypothetical protein
MASPVVARWQIGLGDFMTTEIRVWEFLNYYTFRYMQPRLPITSP